MNCCDDNGRCTCSTGTPRRSCDELAACQSRTPRCDGCKVPADTGQAGHSLMFAPGILEGYRTPFFGTPVQRRELVRLLKFGALWMAVFSLSGFAAVLIAGVWP